MSHTAEEIANHDADTLALEEKAIVNAIFLIKEWGDTSTLPPAVAELALKRLASVPVTQTA